jgi:hypothetical protein
MPKKPTSPRKEQPGLLSRVFGLKSEAERRQEFDAAERRRGLFDAVFKEQGFISERIESLSRMRDEHRRNSTACLTGTPCAACRRYTADIDRLLERYKELERLRQTS